jgi:hypothetical protein
LGWSRSRSVNHVGVNKCHHRIRVCLSLRNGSGGPRYEQKHHDQADSHDISFTLIERRFASPEIIAGIVFALSSESMGDQRASVRVDDVGQDQRIAVGQAV